MNKLSIKDIFTLSCTRLGHNNLDHMYNYFYESAQICVANNLTELLVKLNKAPIPLTKFKAEIKETCGTNVCGEEMVKKLLTNRLADTICSWVEGGRQTLLSMTHEGLKLLKICQEIEKIYVTSTATDINVEQIIKNVAYNHRYDHGYLPQTKEQIEDFIPHEWVVSAANAVLNFTCEGAVNETLKLLRESLESAIDNSSDGATAELCNRDVDLLIEQAENTLLRAKQ